MYALEYFEQVFSPMAYSFRVLLFDVLLRAEKNPTPVVLI